MGEFSGKVVLITGATGGVGEAVTSAFLDAGASLIGVARHPSALPPEVIGYAADLTDAGAVAGMIAALRDYWPRLTAIVHLMGGFAGGAPVPETSVETWDHLMNLNARSAFLVFRALTPLLRHNGGGAILAVGSRAAEETPAGLSAYAASKAALVALVRTLSQENRDLPLTANILLPGIIDTPANRAAMPQADFSTWVQPQTIARLLVYLASPAGRQITGAVIPIYGQSL